MVLGKDLLKLGTESKEYPGKRRIEQVASNLGYDKVAYRIAFKDWWDGYWLTCRHRHPMCNMDGIKLDRNAYRRDVFASRRPKPPKPPVAPKPKANRRSSLDPSARMPVYQIARQQDVSLTAIMIEQSCLCNGCGKDMIQSYDYELDHILPISRGGTNDFWNLQYLCRQCNRTKHAKDPFEWAAYCGVKLPDRFLVGYKAHR